ncbi:MAG: PorP/SprF family type IX secretion system membrane protein [Bacteroidetes bacterium]|nr:PorP/SprF family type IX secretion system membrane protein [Bacteroidota bacterium]
MKNILLLLPILFQVALAQQTPFHKQYYVNPFVINPSMVGTQDHMNLFLMHRSQWTSLPDAPITSTLTFDAPIVSGTNGIGISLFADQTGIFRRNGGSVAYGQQVKLEGDAKLFLGAGVNVFDNRIDFAKVEVVQAGDPYVFQTNQNKTIIDANFGLNLRIKRFDFGSAFNHFGASKRTYQNIKNTAFYRQEWFLQSTASYNFMLSENWELKPLIAFKYFDFSPYQLDLNAILKYKQKVWVAGTYRPEYGVSVAAGLVLYDAITVGYSYDLITNNLRGNAGMSSEIIVGIKFGNKKDTKKDFKDSDQDGVSDDDDLEPNTPYGNMVNFQGVTIPKVAESKDTVYNNTTTKIDSSAFYAIEEQLLLLQKDPISFFYDYDRAELKGGQDDKLVKLVRIMLLDPGAKLTLYGNADSSGSDSYNMRLASRRANTVKDVLTKEFKIDPTRIEIISKGKRDPLTPFRSGINRRVDADIIPSIKRKVEMMEITDDQEEGMNQTEPVEKKDKMIYDLFPASTDVSNELIYTCQLGVFKNTQLESRWDDISPLYQLKLTDGTIRYFSGVYGSEAEAETNTRKVQLNGLTDAFTSAYYKGQRITLEKARELERQQGENLTRRK